MVRRRWSIPLEGDDQGGIVLDTNGRILVSTLRRIEADEPAGLSHGTLATVGDSASTTTYINMHAHRCYAIEPGGGVAWTADGVQVKCGVPDGTLIATNDDHDLLVLDRDGVELERQAVGTEAWAVSGWVGTEPLLTTTATGTWVEPCFYELFDHHLHRYDRAGNLLAKHAIPREPFDAERRRRPEVPDWFEHFHFPARFDLAYDARRRRLIASHWSLMSWVMSLQLDGSVDWVSLVGHQCCNTICFVGDGVTVHTSSCGARVSFLSPDGVIFRARDVPGAYHAFSDDRGAACVVTSDAIRAFDEHGEPRWAVEFPNLWTAAVRAGILYAVAGKAGRLELIAFDVG